MGKLIRKYAFAIHGGAGTVSRTTMTMWKEKAYHEALKRALLAGTAILEKGGRAMDAVIESVRIMENSSLFNAGKGSVFTHDGKHEMDAALMEGKSLKAGAASGVQFVRNPILLARAIMKHSRHVMLGGPEAVRFAKKFDIEIKPQEYFYDEFRYKQWQKAKSKDKIILDHDIEEEKKYGTVGAVAMDKRGNLAAATSTGGMVNKKFGRIGDSPIIGAGTYADNNTCAVSCTGHGEYFIRYVVAHELSCMIKYGQKSLKEAAEYLVFETLKKAGGKGGLIAVDRNGNISMPFNTKGMYRAYKKEGEEEYVGIYR
ncbi:isoaspartyl peptidase/L-asparaginase [Fulvivirgaceae bacterium BMA10]|uniref:Isoaspartyl peptidase/L-asparaginase n=1 Tax=Splendidivirga corallicola TaxID=3051826 RepID=A0ABT8KSY9_9BACT|nr:isoaspartyl peptidase/L-asparaginase [Fulvivirgaceae bacterium BMA10]